MCCNKYFESDLVYDQTVLVFAKNELHLICSTSPIMVPLPIEILERQTQQFLHGMIILRIAPQILGTGRPALVDFYAKIHAEIDLDRLMQK